MIDAAVIADLQRAEGSPEAARRRFESLRSDAVQAAGRLRHLAVRGDLAAVLEEAGRLRAEAEPLGLRRLANRLIELERVAVLDELGQAHLQSQALARLIDDEIEADFDALDQHLRANAET